MLQAQSTQKCTSVNNLHVSREPICTSSARSVSRSSSLRPQRRTAADGTAPSRRGWRLAVSAMSGDSKEPQTGASGMTREEAREVLGLAREASFDRALQAKNKKLSQQQDPEKKMRIEAAYDILLMDSMRQRLTGQSDVAKSVRFADVARPKPNKQAPAPSLPGGLKISRPANQILTTQSAVFGLLAVWTLVQALAASPSYGQEDTGIPSLQLAVSIAASAYFLRENKRLGLGKAAAVTGGGFVLGSILGALLQQWLRVDIVPIGSFSSPGALVGEFAILALWASSTFVL